MFPFTLYVFMAYTGTDLPLSL